MIKIPNIVSPTQKGVRAGFQPIESGTVMHEALKILAQSATAEDLGDFCGWLLHTARGRISDLRRGYGYDIRIECQNGRYWIVGDADKVYSDELRRFEESRRATKASRG